MDCCLDVETLLVEEAHPGGKTPSRTGNQKRRDVTFDVEGMTCQSCVKIIDGALSGLDGIIEMKTSLERDQTWIRYDISKVSEDHLKTAIEDCGFDAEVSGKGPFKVVHSFHQPTKCTLFTYPSLPHKSICKNVDSD